MEIDEAIKLFSSVTHRGFFQVGGISLQAYCRKCGGKTIEQSQRLQAKISTPALDIFNKKNTISYKECDDQMAQQVQEGADAEKNFVIEMNRNKNDSRWASLGFDDATNNYAKLCLCLHRNAFSLQTGNREERDGGIPRAQ